MGERSLTRSDRAKAIVMEDGGYLTGFSIPLDLPPRYLATEVGEDGKIEEIQQAETLVELVKLLEASEAEGTNTEIHDLDTGDILRPDFERIYRIPRVYLGRVVVYRAPVAGEEKDGSS